MAETKLYFHTREAAALLSLSPRTLEKLRVTGGGPAFHKFGRRVAYRREENRRLAKAMPAKAIAVAQDETFTGGLCLVAMDPKCRPRSSWSRIMCASTCANLP